ncbi:DUF2510 domain-containing protein [Streptomyces sp. DSM 44915]|uniref:DUF2510 domain-containing protein n=1 Tax=Streptomyces chisholmiae TaxID=3075540 RepID=A0ABU2JZJ7_9ACTN|nr:DUF2510 domain-containing protein [Streptomyces sp. DSM 44915]MDT0269959.1 DUF2510 domain-containing protein [Streptomyces sp. DSM 44915]
MSQTTPPGWYQDPGHEGAEPAPERWWNGTAWTSLRRPAGGPPRTPTLPALPADAFGTPPGSLPTLPGDRPVTGARSSAPAPRRGRWRERRVLGLGLLGLAVAGAVLGALLVGDEGRPGPTRADGTGPSPTADDGAQGGALTENRVGGVALPVPDGWRERSGGPGATVVYGGYPCPADETLDCLAGSATLRALPGAGTFSTEGSARSDLLGHQRDSYPAEAYGGIFGTEELAAESVTVAGQPGYRVRVALTTPVASAVVETVAFVSPEDPSTLLLLRLSWDDVAASPPLTDLDRILRGVLTVSDGPGTAA